MQALTLAEFLCITEDGRSGDLGAGSHVGSFPLSFHGAVLSPLGPHCTELPHLGSLNQAVIVSQAALHSLRVDCQACGKEPQEQSSLDPRKPNTVRIAEARCGVHSALIREQGLAGAEQLRATEQHQALLQDRCQPESRRQAAPDRQLLQDCSVQNTSMSSSAFAPAWIASSLGGRKEPVPALQTSSASSLLALQPCIASSLWFIHPPPASASPPALQPCCLPAASASVPASANAFQPPSLATTPLSVDSWIQSVKDVAVAAAAAAATSTKTANPTITRRLLAAVHRQALAEQETEAGVSGQAALGTSLPGMHKRKVHWASSDDETGKKKKTSAHPGTQPCTPTALGTSSSSTEVPPVRDSPEQRSSSHPFEEAATMTPARRFQPSSSHPSDEAATMTPAIRLSSSRLVVPRSPWAQAMVLETSKAAAPTGSAVPRELQGRMIVVEQILEVPHQDSEDAGIHARKEPKREVPERPVGPSCDGAVREHIPDLNFLASVVPDLNMSCETEVM